MNLDLLSKLNLQIWNGRDFFMRERKGGGGKNSFFLFVSVNEFINKYIFLRIYLKKKILYNR